jgi:hypothetical protein
MNKIAILSILFQFCLNDLKCQIKFTPDSLNGHYRDKVIWRLDSTFHLIKDVDFEFRFFSDAGYGKRMKVFIISLKGSHWTVRFFENRRDSMLLFTEKKISNDRTEQLWLALEKKGILTFPNYWQLKDSLNQDTQYPGIHGTDFYFEFLASCGRRSCVYKCPNSFKEEYPYIPEYRKVADIIKLIFVFCGLPAERIC